MRLTLLGLMEQSVSLSLIKDSLLDRLARSKAHFKSQQIGEDDLTFENKRTIAQNLLDHDVSLFLQRFHKFLILEDLEFFELYGDSYETRFYIEEIRKQHDENKRMIKVKNRRYEAMQRLVREGEYFGDIEMRHRNPHLYDQMIGQFLTEEEKRIIDPMDPEATFTTFLMKTIEHKHENEIRIHQKEAEEGAIEETETDSESESEIEEEMPTPEDKSQEIDEIDIGNVVRPTPISVEEKEMLRHEFINIMVQQFLSGKDEYDYSTVDDNVELDSIQIRQIDEEAKYFDSEEPNDC